MANVRSDFYSEGLRCAGNLLLPEGADRVPVVILGHGFAAERAFALPEFAEAFVRNGIAAYYFDYRCFGDSEGEPRHWVDPARHQQDWRNAIAHVRSMREIDATKIALWGSSFSGGHVLQLAAEDEGLAAVIAQVPHVSGPATIAGLPIKNIVQGTLAGLKDVFGSIAFGKPFYSPVIGRPGDFAAMSSEECWDGWFAMVPEGSSWENKVLSRIFLKLALFSPIRNAHRITAPTLVIAGKHDTVTPPDAAAETAKRIPKGEFHLLDCNHFEVYKGEMFNKVIALEIEFLKRAFASDRT